MCMCVIVSEVVCVCVSLRVVVCVCVRLIVSEVVCVYVCTPAKMAWCVYVRVCVYQRV